MAEYIEREAVIAVIYGQHIGGKEACENARPNTYGADLREIVADIEDIPAADVVAVVRCGECENWQRGWESTSAPKGTHFCAVTGLFKPTDWFCADGAKMGGME